MYVDSMKKYKMIREFTNSCLDKRTNSYKSLKTTNTLCRQSIERYLNENSDIQRAIAQSNDQWAWIKELIINYTLLKMHYHAVLWETDAHEPQIQGDHETSLKIY